MDKKAILHVALFSILFGFLVVTGSKLIEYYEKPTVKVNDTGKTVYDAPCIIFVKDYTKYNVKHECVIPSYEPQGFIIDTCDACKIVPY